MKSKIWTLLASSNHDNSDEYHNANLRELCKECSQKTINPAQDPQLLFEITNTAFRS